MSRVLGPTGKISVTLYAPADKIKDCDRVDGLPADNQYLIT